MTDLPSPCPCCGAYSLDPSVQTTQLLAVCDVLVIRALEVMGRYIVRQERARYAQRGERPWHILHTVWRADDDITSKALKGAWDVVPPLVDVHGCCGVTGLQVTAMLNEYVHDLVITGTPHVLDELAYRFETRLGLVLPAAVAVSLFPYPLDTSAVLDQNASVMSGLDHAH